MRLCVRDAATRAAIAQGRVLYVGRACCGFGASALANPFKADLKKPGATIPAYRKWLWTQIQRGRVDVLAELARVHELGAVACWCPLPSSGVGVGDLGSPEQTSWPLEGQSPSEDTCHGAVVLKAAAWYARSKASQTEEAVEASARLATSRPR